MTRAQILASRVTLVLLLGAVTWLSLWPSVVQVGPSDKLDHLAAYFVLALCADFAFPAAGYLLPKAAPLFLYGFLMEVLQRYVPGRSSEGLDLVANASGLLLYGVGSALLRILRARAKR